MFSYYIHVVCSLYVMFLLPPERAPKVLAPSLFYFHPVVSLPYPGLNFTHTLYSQGLASDDDIIPLFDVNREGFGLP